MSLTEKYLNYLSWAVQKAQASSEAEKNTSEQVGPSNPNNMDIDWQKLKNNKTIEVLEGITEIPANACERFENLESVILPSTLLEIGNGAFYGCDNLKNIDFSRCSKLERISQGAFQECGSLQHVNLPSSLLSIGDDAFARTGLTEIVVPDSVVDIGPGAFRKNEHLVSATIGRSAKGYAYFYGSARKGFKEGAEIFKGTPELKELTFRSNVAEYTGAKTLLKVTFDNTVKELGYWAVVECPDLEEVVMADSVTKIGYAAFAACQNLSSVTIPDSVEEMELGVFDNTRLKEIVFPAGLRKLGRLGGTMDKLRKLDFSKVTKLEEIPEGFLGDFPKLREVSLPMGVKIVREDIGGENLNRLFLPPTVEEVEDLCQVDLNIYCFAPILEELGTMVESVEEKEDACHLFVLPEYLDAYKAQFEAESITEDALTIDIIPEELRYYYDN